MLIWKKLLLLPCNVINRKALLLSPMKKPNYTCIKLLKALNWKLKSVLDLFGLPMALFQ